VHYPQADYPTAHGVIAVRVCICLRAKTVQKLHACAASKLLLLLLLPLLLLLLLLLLLVGVYGPLRSCRRRHSPPLPHRCAFL
jgi:hypothetical protein